MHNENYAEDDAAFIKTCEIALEARGPYMTTFSGILFHPLNPHKDEIDIEDIAHALSLICRFGGHCTEFYSVAEHSVRCCDYLDKLDYYYPKLNEAKLHVLLHDASEAYISDIIRPIKPSLEGYKPIEERIQNVIFEKYQCTTEYIKRLAPNHNVMLNFPAHVKQCDDTLLRTEGRDLHLKGVEQWGIEHKPLKRKIAPWTSRRAEREFLKRFDKYKGRNVED